MKSLLALIVIALLIVGAAACGSTNKGTGSTSPSSSAIPTAATTAKATSTASLPGYAKVDADKDNDISSPVDDKNNNSALYYGHAASAVDTQAVTELVKRYYAVAVAGDGASACSMIFSSLAESVVEDYGHGSAGPSYLRAGKTCPATMDLLFKHFHSQLTAQFPELKVTRVRLAGKNGYAILSFGTMPEREILVSLEQGTWKVGTLLDTELP